MKLSRFNIWVTDYPRAGAHLIFNTRTHALIKVNQEFKDALENLSLAGVGSNGHSMLDADTLRALENNGIIVAGERHEDEKINDFFRQLQYEECPDAFETTILTTFNCNFRCVYCFEESVKDNVMMDKATSDRAIRWLITKMESRRHTRLFIVYYGGEPLMNIRPIYDISWHMQAWAGANGAEFAFGIITNGSLLSRHLIDIFRTVGLKEVRVSIDGSREFHDAMRPFADGRPSFDVIMKNIRSIIGTVEVGIAGNFDRKNVASIPAFLDYLENEGLLHKLQKIDFAPLAPRLGPKHNPGAIELNHCLSMFGADGVADELVEIKKELLRRGVLSHTGLAINGCSLVMRDAGITIDPRGLLYTCNALVGYPEFSVGSVHTRDLNERSADFMRGLPWQKCPRDCAYLPMCQGGCRFFSFLENNNFSDISCKRAYFDRMTPELVKLEYQKLAAA